MKLTITNEKRNVIANVSENKIRNAEKLTEFGVISSVINRIIKNSSESI